ncbi:flagellar filament capping protein FliD [Quadrisphaera oryzae]|uniref:flagellar filament capping protein FliD n=1 Tax=Quadrisphaera TaxID=317661 RepID=UPI00164812F6|nr:flagellar filament capping protein FliD [Quadrisphaera sp. RL12-1S]MBC3763775.1 flagellar filament capping protein FliD [Quadrisphaera sp. RL12-1S]
MSSSTTSISGLVSGIDSKSIISQLMQIAAQPQADLKTKLATTNAQISAAQGINAKAASITSLAATLADPATYTKAAASSTNSSVTATADITAGVGSVSFNVTALAQSTSKISSVIPAPPTTGTGSGPLTFSFTPQGGSAVSITAASGSAADIASAINAASFSGQPTGASSAGYSAVVVNGSSGAQLQITSKDTGATSGFSTSGLPTSGSNDSFTTLQSGSDATIQIVGSTAAASSSSGVTLTSHSNTFTNLMPGVNVTVSAVTTNSTAGGVNTPVTVSTAVNQGALSSQLTSLVTGMNAVLDDISFHTQIVGKGVTPSATNGGLLQGDGTLRDTGNALLSTVSDSVGSSAATLAGLAVTRDGHITFDASKFSALYASDPARAAKVLQAFGTAVKAAGATASDPVSGAITGLINGDKSDVTSLTNSISDWDQRLLAKQTLLTSQYAALEVALGKIKDQGNAVTAALGQLSGNNNN